MSLRITTLVENSKGEHLALKNEHGLSFFIEKDSHCLLFDTGQSDAYLENAKQLKIDISRTEVVVLSHGHYDHSGGFVDLLTKTRNFELIMGSGFFNEKYGEKKGSLEYLGNNFDESFLKDKQVSYRFVEQDLTEIIPGVYVITNFPRIHKDEVISPRFKVLRNGKFIQDLFEDEVLIAIETKKGLVVLLGCSHPGVRNMLDHVRNLLDKPIYAVLGGTHLVEANEDAMEQAVEYLSAASINLVGVSHCTGEKAMLRLRSAKENYFHNSTGSSLLV